MKTNLSTENEFAITSSLGFFSRIDNCHQVAVFSTDRSKAKVFNSRKKAEATVMKYLGAGYGMDLVAVVAL